MRALTLNIAPFLPLLFLLCSINAGAQGVKNLLPEDIEYISPIPGSRHILPENSIIIKTGEAFHPDILKNIPVTVEGSKSGIISGSWKLSKDMMALIFDHHEKYRTSEKITVTINAGDIDRGQGKQFSYSFFTTETNNDEYEEQCLQVLEKFYLPAIQEYSPSREDSIVFQTTDSLPDNFHDIWITAWDDPSPGYTFVLPLDFTNLTYYLTMLDNYGTPVFYRETKWGGMDFKLHPNHNLLTWWDSDIRVFLGMNSRAEVVDTFAMGNGYTTDLHELIMMDNGNYWTLGYDPQIVGMDTVVPGGHPEALVTGLIVQELDPDDNVLFQWRSWDHYEITDVSGWIDLTDSIIDYVHGNSIAVDSDTSVLISARNMNEITKIDRRTGDIIWRWNGENDQFNWINDELKFKVQHSIRVMENGHFSVFDNGGAGGFSSAVEYDVDETNMNVRMVQRIRRTPDAHANFMGHAQRLENGNTVCGWGDDLPGATEFDPNGNMVLEFAFPYLNYRSFKFEWQNGLFDTYGDTIDFGSLWNDTVVSATLTLENTSEKSILFNRIVRHDSPFIIDIEAPFTLGPFTDTNITVTYQTEEQGYFYDMLTFCSDTDTGLYKKRIGTQVFLEGSYKYESNIIENEDIEVSVFPNPFTGFLNVRSNVLIENIRIYTIDGHESFSIGNLGTKQTVIDLEKAPYMPAGLYIIRIEFRDGVHSIRKMLKL